MSNFIILFRRFRIVRVALGFMLIGAIFAGFGIYMCTVPEKERLTTTGTLVEIVEGIDAADDQVTHETYVDYTIDGKEYKHAYYGAYETGMKVGDTVEIQYLAEDPENIQAPGAEKVKYVFAGAGIVAFIIGLGTLIKFIVAGV